MSITIWDIFKYLYKWKFVILLVTALFIGAAFLYVNRNQTYSAKAIIQYNDKCIGNGKTLNGRTFDANEIKAPSVLMNVLKDLGLENKKIESIRDHTTITPITPKSAENLKAAKEKMGEEYRYYPRTFMITYDGNGSFETTRDVLSSIIANYYKYYSESYLYLATLNEVDYNLNKKNFDYIEQAEQINENLKQTIDMLATYSKDSNNYRSPTTGLTFDDLKKEFELIDEYSMPLIFSKIYDGKITQNKDMLISKYAERVDQNERERDNLLFKTDLTLDRMETYVEVDGRAGGTSTATEAEDVDLAISPLTTTNASMLQGIERDERDDVEEQTTYDGLITNYANESVAANSKSIEAEYCQAMIDRFKAERAPGIDYEEYEREVRLGIANVLAKMALLYTQANVNITDYNAFIPALHIQKLSGVCYYTNLSRSVYMLIGAIIGFALSCMLAIGCEVMKKYSQYEKKEKEKEQAEKEAEETPEGENAGNANA